MVRPRTATAACRTQWRARDGVWRSLAARCVRDAEAAGSNPATPTNGRPQRRPAGCVPNAMSSYLRCVDFATWQKVIGDTYGERDRARGLPASVAWLAEEVGEFAKAARKG